MKKTYRTIQILAVALGAAAVMMSSVAMANGFYIQEMSASGLAQAGATVAAGADASNQYANAANLSYTKGFWIEAGATVFLPYSSYTNPVTGDVTKASSAPQYVPFFFASYKINDWLAVGVAEFTNFGLAINWPEDWEGNHKIISSSMQTFTINPNISFGPFKGFSIAVGFDAMYGNFKIKKALTLGLSQASTSPISTINLSGEAWGFGANIGLMYQPTEWVRIGAAYRSGIKISANNGSVDFQDIPVAWSNTFRDQKFKANINLPHVVFMGIRFWPTKNLSIELDAQWVQWSTWDKLTFNLSEGLAGNKELHETSNYRDAWQLRLGGEYKFYKNHFVVRAGFLWDQNPASSQYLNPMLPDSERVMPCIGFGTEWAGFFVDIAYMPVFTLKRTVTWADDQNDFPGTYESVIHDITLTLGYHFDVVKGKVKIPTYGELESPADVESPDVETKTEAAPATDEQAIQNTPTVI
jgi:long-chain fatty acid transport protein